jgi:hypothetical protein
VKLLPRTAEKGKRKMRREVLERKRKEKNEREKESLRGMNEGETAERVLFSSSRSSRSFRFPSALEDPLASRSPSILTQGWPT